MFAVPRRQCPLLAPTDESDMNEIIVRPIRPCGEVAPRLWTTTGAATVRALNEMRLVSGPRLCSDQATFPQRGDIQAARTDPPTLLATVFSRFLRAPSSALVA
jgi:hypothetical protein